MKCPLPEAWCSRDYWAGAPWFTRAALMLLHALDEEAAAAWLWVKWWWGGERERKGEKERRRLRS